MVDLPTGTGGVGGELAGGRYLIEGHLGAGGGGEVFAARDTLLERAVAIKRLPQRPSAGDDGEAAEAAARLLAEARALAHLSDPHIVAVHDAFEEGGRLHVVMEQVAGPTLREHLDTTGPLAVADLARLAAHLARALAHAHGQDIVHRDVKPENVLLALADPGWTAKLADFGLAYSPSRARLTQAGMAVGTPAYVAPEQALGHTVDARADLYALGCLLYEAATGAPPFAGDDPFVVVNQHLHAAPAPPSSRRADLPPTWDTLLLRLLAKRPEARFPSATALLADLTTLADLAGAVSAADAADTADTADRSAHAGPRHNLPAQLTSFVGRQRELAEVTRLLASNRLVTLTGPGGTGKTRLALHMAATALHEYPQGVWLVELAPLTDPALVPQAVAVAVRVREEPGRPLVAVLHDALKTRRLLLVLDNCEHAVDSCARLADALLRACPEVHILATSREVLGIAGETAFRVPSLALPDPQRPPLAERLVQYDAVRLFAARALAVQPAFAVTDRNAAAVAELCSRLDGIPLALELAASRLRVLPVEQLLVRLEDRFRLLTGGSRTALPRQQTLEAAVAWSYDLLDEPERLLFRRLSVFAGGFTLEAAEVVCSSQSAVGNDGGSGPGDAAPEGTGAGLAAAHGLLPTEDVLDVLTRLVDKSLVVAEEQAGATGRYRLLETLRQYAQQKLAASGGAVAVRDRHAAYLLAETEARAARVEGAAMYLSEQDFAWFAREHDNLRAALSWLRDRGDAERGLRLGAFLGLVWVHLGHLSEGRAWLVELLALPGATAPQAARLRLRALDALASLARRQTDYAAARALYEEGLALARATGDRQAEVWALFRLANLAFVSGDAEATCARVEQMLAAAEALGDPDWQADADRLLGGAALLRHDYAAARAHLEAALAAWRAAGRRLSATYMLQLLGQTALGQGNRVEARSHFVECLDVAREFGDQTLVAMTLEGLVAVAAAAGQPERAARLAGAAAALRAALGVPLTPDAAADLERQLEPARLALGAERYGAAWAAGEAMPVEQAVAVALAEGDDGSGHP